jgi:hypothetical protein
MTSNSHYVPVTPRRVRAPGLHPPQNRHLVGRVPSPGVPISSIMRIAGKLDPETPVASRGGVVPQLAAAMGFAFPEGKTA